MVSQRVPVERINRITQKNHQGVVAFLSPVAYHYLDDLIPSLFEAGKFPFVVVLDGITDVRNFGAIARTCECSGVDAIIIPEKNSVSVNADAVKTSAGAPLCISGGRGEKLNKGIKQMKKYRRMVVGANQKSRKKNTTFE